MYKNLIIVAIFIFIFGGGYLIIGAGDGLIGDIVLRGNKTEYTLIPITEEQILGIYTCNSSVTCKNKYTLILKEDKTVELVKTNTSSKENKELVMEEDVTSSIFNEKGTWEIGIHNMLIITITGQEEEMYILPQKIVIKNVGTNTLSNANYTKEHYKDIDKLIFIKQQ